ncbi:MAG: glycosyltransferase family 4 protein [Candidatus Andersenbacteria bacterium]|nr:glycosyltransferase family 4 protein [Candidatus Andersenbacteria bacterium]MBI3250890.1 glycosyltransferase family 4 protein [Candidatus Andersenbacteria bacterium]
MATHVVSIKPYPSTWPPDSGGQQRSYHMYANLPAGYKTIVIEPASPSTPANTELIHISWPKPWFSAAAEIIASLLNRGHADNLAVLDILSSASAVYRRTLSQVITPASIVCVEHCYAYEPILRLPRRALIYSAHNVEYDLKKIITPRSFLRPFLLKHVFVREKKLCEKADHIITCTEVDKKRLSNLYSIPLEKITVVPNGSDTTATKPKTPTEREATRHRLHSKRPMILFLGSLFPPNIAAANFITNILAPALPQYTFVIAGSVGAHFTNTHIHANHDLILPTSGWPGYGFAPLDYWLNRIGHWTSAEFGLHISDPNITAVELTSASFIPSLLTLQTGDTTVKHILTPWPEQTVIPLSAKKPRWIRGTIFPSIPTTQTVRLGMATQRLRLKRKGIWEKIDIGQVHNIHRWVAANVCVVGSLSEEEKELLLAASHLAINPVAAGSGSHLKMFEYMASGLPILTTPIGARGIADQEDDVVSIAPLDQFASTLKTLMENETQRQNLSQAARAYVVRTHDWKNISEAFARLLTSVVP